MRQCLALIGFAALLWSAAPAWSQSTINPDTGFGYPNINAALRDLLERQGLPSAIENNWLIVTDARTSTLWSFAPNTHPAFPTGVRRQIIERDGRILIDMDILCGADKPACDQVKADFDALNVQVREHLARGQTR